MRRADLAAIVFLTILAFFLVADLFLHPGRSITFDAHVHITTISQFFNAMHDGEFPARWAQGFANYGHPLPLVAQQTTSYLGAFFQIFTHNAVLSYNLVVFTGALASSLLLYRFLRYWYTPWSATMAAALFTFAPYRITNIYTRGASPEFFAALFIPLGLIGMYQLIQQRRWLGGVWVAVAVAGLVLTHPMVLVIGSVVLAPYALFMSWPWWKNWRPIVWLVGFGGLGLMSAMYYVLPLLREIKYFNYGNMPDRYRGSENFLPLKDFFLESWLYFGPNHPGPRAETLVLGSFEAVILLLLGGAAVAAIWRGNRSARRLLPWLVAGAVAIFLMMPASQLLYRHVFLLNNIQYPWRNLAALMFVPPVLLAWGLDRVQMRWVGAVFLLMVFVVRFPELYGKNFMIYDLSHYDFTTANLHTANLNTVWTGDVRDYPVQIQQYGVIEGNATVEVSQVKNSYRKYQVSATTEARLADYTFYFPGWEVLIDGQETLIEYQDAQHRGYITYRVPAGEHEVVVRFGETKIRQLGKVITVATLLVGVGIWLLRGRLTKWGLGLLPH